MSNKRGQWLTRRGQADVVAAIDQVIDQQPQPGEQVHQVPDELIEDSPYQARRPLMHKAWLMHGTEYIVRRAGRHT